MAATGSADHWSSRPAFLLASIGSAVGLGNLVRFPAEAGANGGAAFVLFYILCVVLIGVPLLLSETLIGRHGQAAAPASYRKLAVESGASPRWEWVAGIGVFSSTLVLGFYCVLGGWVLYYIGVFFADMLTSGVTGTAFQGMSVEAVEGLFPALVGNGPL
ncbi:MAG: sodium-dependent transporter, partial [Alteraurantiacibacter sp.]|nr:sodium-dependent transporter [Alteraurantiacibacter sp.]